MKIAAAIFGHACFIASWVFFSGRAGVLSPEIKGAIPAYLPFAGYGFLLLMSLLESRILGIKIMKSFAGLSPFLTVFAALFGVSVFTGMTLPDPHNFMLRKLEILQGSSFAVFVFITSVAVIFRIWKSGAIRRKDDKNGSTALFSFFLIFYCALSVWFGTANEPTGDETAYLMAAHSLVYDGDLDMKNNFENRDYRNFYSRELKPQGKDLNINGKMYPKHPLLMSLIISPAYRAAGVPGVILLMCVFSAFLPPLLFLIAQRVSGEHTASLASAVLAGFSLPLLGSINLSATDILCGLLPAAAYYIYKFRPQKALLFSVIMAALFWIHLRMMPVYAMLCLLFVISNRKNPAGVLVFAAIQAASAAAYFGINLHFYRDLIPYSSYQTGGIRTGSYLIRGLFAYLFDRQLGLFTYAPFYAFFIPGIIIMINRKISAAPDFAAIGIPYYLLISAYAEWGWGSSSPRYLMPLLFIFCPAVAVALAVIKDRAAKIVASVAVILSLSASLIVSAIPWFRWDRQGHENWLIFMLDKFTGINLNVIMPSLINIENNTPVKTALWIFVCVLITVMVLRESRKKQDSGVFARPDGEDRKKKAGENNLEPDAKG